MNIGELKPKEKEKLKVTMNTAGWDVFAQLCGMERQKILETFTNPRDGREEDEDRGQLKFIKRIALLEGDVKKITQ